MPGPRFKGLESKAPTAERAWALWSCKHLGTMTKQTQIVAQIPFGVVQRSQSCARGDRQGSAKRGWVINDLFAPNLAGALSCRVALGA